MAQMKLVYTSSSKLDSIDIVDGQIIFVSDETKICLDMRGKRLVYNAIKTYDTDNERITTPPTNKSFYFVFETNVMWQYNNGWRQITPSNLVPITYYPEVEELPVIGETNKLYYTDSGIYNWHASDNEYNLIANANRWNSI